jgi:hypothetical protein
MKTICEKKPLRLGVLCAFVLLVALSRMIPHPSNLAPIGAMSLFGEFFDPFKTLLGDFFYVGLLFGSFEYAKHRFPLLKTKSVCSYWAF